MVKIMLCLGVCVGGKKCQLQPFLVQARLKPSILTNFYFMTFYQSLINEMDLFK